MRRILRSWVGLAVALFVGGFAGTFPTAAHAQRTTVLRAEGTASLGATAGADAASSVEATARAEGLALLADRDDADGLRGEILTCGAPSCVITVLRTLGLDFATVVAVWARRGGSEPSEVTVSLVDGTETQVQVRRPVPAEAAPGTVGSIASAAFVEAIARFRRRGDVVLRVLGQPVGAAVAIDGRPVGRLPLTHAVSPGPAEITVSLAGYRTERRHVTVPGPDQPETTVHVRLVAEPEAPPAPATSAPPPPEPPQEAPEPRRRRAFWAGSITLAVAGAASLTAGTYALAAAHCEARGPTGACLLEERASPAGVGIALGVGTLALAASATWIVLHLRDEAPSAEVGLSPGGVVLRGRF